MSTVNDMMTLFEGIVILVYDSTSTYIGVIEARKDLFLTEKNENRYHPSDSQCLALTQKEISIYQAYDCWGKCLVPTFECPCPNKSGTVKGDTQT